MRPKHVTPHISAKWRTALWLAALSPAAGAQNLLENPGFDNGTAAPWTQADPGVGVWNDLDYEGDDASGSALLLNTATGEYAWRSGFKQCVILDRPSNAFRLRFSAIAEPGQVDGRLGAHIFFALGPAACGEQPFWRGRSISPAAAAVWQTVDAVVPMRVNLIAGDAIELHLAVQKSPENGSFGGFIDNVVLESVGLFGDGFDFVRVPIGQPVSKEARSGQQAGDDGTCAAAFDADPTRATGVRKCSPQRLCASSGC